MTRLTRWLLAAAFVAALALPVLQPLVADAQRIPGPGTMIRSSRTSVTVTNTIAGTPLWTWDIPAGFAAPLHLRLEGTLSTPAAVTTANVTCNYGGANASLTLLNGSIATAPFPLSATNIPLTIDFRVRPTPTWSAATPMGVALFGVLAASGTQAATVPGVASASLAMSALVPTNGTTNGQVNVNSTSGNTLSCQWMWGGAASTEKILTIWQGNLYLGE